MGAVNVFNGCIYIGILGVNLASFASLLRKARRMWSFLASKVLISFQPCLICCIFHQTLGACSRLSAPLCAQCRHFVVGGKGCG